jgi:hypothetical protein
MIEDTEWRMGPFGLRPPLTTQRPSGGTFWFSRKTFSGS